MGRPSFRPQCVLQAVGVPVAPWWGRPSQNGGQGLNSQRAAFLHPMPGLHALCTLFPEPSCGRALLDPSGPHLGGKLLLSSGNGGVVPQGTQGSDVSLSFVTSCVCVPPTSDSTAVCLSFHIRNAPPPSVLDECGRSWCLWSLYFSHHVSGRRRLFPWGLSSEAWKAQQPQLWVGAPLCPRHHVANP